MACPDELTLDLWLADALPADEAAQIDRHVASCGVCMASQIAWQAAHSSLRAALSLDANEQAYLAGLNLPATWRARPVPVSAPWWGWLTVLGLITAFFAWTFAGPAFEPIVTTAGRVGLGSILANSLLDLLFSVGRTLVDVATSPALGLAQPVLAACAVALLLTPRLKTTLQGVLP